MKNYWISKMKVMAFNGSPRNKKWNTFTLLKKTEE